ncbi:hypothetical protein BHM03_00002411 [Ensete ventricosum]|nr:hypothetical protein BHM03_00002411 [Ensete ventricosum]
MLADGTPVAVKCAKLGNTKSTDQMLNEVRVLSEVNHRSLVRLRVHSQRHALRPPPRLELLTSQNAIDFNRGPDDRDTMNAVGYLAMGCLEEWRQNRRPMKEVVEETEYITGILEAAGVERQNRARVGNHDEEAVCYGNAGGASDDVVLLRELVSRERVVRGHMAVAVAGSDLEAGVCSERAVALLVRAVVCDEWVAHIHDEAAARMVEEGIHNKAALSSASLVVLVFHGAAAGGSAAAVELIRRSIKLLLYRPSSSSCLSSPFQRDGVVTGARATKTSGTVPLRGRRLKHGVQFIEATEVKLPYFIFQTGNRKASPSSPFHGTSRFPTVLLPN